MRLLEAWTGNECIMRVYIQLGRNPKGHKQCEGDGRTPEGAYRISGRNPNSSYYRNLGISYPEPKDIQPGINPGGAIKIHALPNTRTLGARFYTQHDWTDGCIALSEAAADYLFACCPDETPIYIYP